MGKRHFTEEHRRKLSESHKGQVPWMLGKHHTEETKKKLSESHKGQVPWMLGKHHTKATKKKISEAGKGRIPWNKGKKMTEEYRRIQSLARKGKPFTEERKLAMKEVFGSPSARKANSERINKFYKEHPEARLRMSEKMKQLYKERPEIIQKMREGLKQYYRNHPEVRYIISERVRKYYQEHPEARQSIKERVKNPDNAFGSYPRRRPYKNTGIIMRSNYEEDFANTMDSLGIPWEYEPLFITYYKEEDNSEHQYLPDFYLPTLDMFVEVKNSHSLRKGRINMREKIKGVHRMNKSIKIIFDKNWDNMIRYISDKEAN